MPTPDDEIRQIRHEGSFIKRALLLLLETGFTGTKEGVEDIERILRQAIANCEPPDITDETLKK